MKKNFSFSYYINRLITLPIIDEAKDSEWRTILEIAKRNGYPTSKMHNLKTRLMNKKQNQKQQQERTDTRKYMLRLHISAL
jgi:hypothetical protein